uniref:Uncharacterized protein n=1 Tax=Biomphalaria glabrata TaxID=6526 RepID=A0A2C9KVL9_BIOGL
MISNNSKLSLRTSFMTLTCEIIHSLMTIKSQMYDLREIIIIFTWTSVFLLCDSLHDSTSTQLNLIDHDFHQNVNRPTTKNHIEENSLTSYPKSKMLQPYSKYGYADLYKPIRILPFYSFDEQLLPEEKEALQRVIEKAVRKISKLLSVIRLTSPLLLPRSECPAIFGVGINKGKLCSDRKQNDEYCQEHKYNMKILVHINESLSMTFSLQSDMTRVTRRQAKGGHVLFGALSSIWQAWI